MVLEMAALSYWDRRQSIHHPLCVVAAGAAAFAKAGASSHPKAPSTIEVEVGSLLE